MAGVYQKAIALMGRQIDGGEVRAGAYVRHAVIRATTDTVILRSRALARRLEG
jgi:hypothetical protein